MFQNDRYVSADPWQDKHGKTFQPGSHYFVGGASKMYGAAHFRLRERDFESVMHVDGESPEWPLKYDVFEPLLPQSRGVVPRAWPSREDPTEPPASSAYPYAPISHEPRMQKLSDDLRSAGCIPSRTHGCRPRRSQSRVQRVRALQPLRWISVWCKPRVMQRSWVFARSGSRQCLLAHRR